MIVLGLTLLLLALDLHGRIAAQRLLRRAGGLGIAALAALSWWNHEARIARHNLERAVETARLDATYCVWGLSADAVPALTGGTNRLPPALAADLRVRLLDRYGPNTTVRSCHWYEWNLRAIETVHALRGAGILEDSTAGAPAAARCIQLDARSRSR